MATGLYLTVGLNAIDPSSYGGQTGILKACENDARDFAALAESSGFTGDILLTAEATASAVLARLYSASQTLTSGDILFVGYSGHGAQVGDVTAEEDDGLDETWCLYDRMMVDDELYAMWAKFKPGVRILIFSDSCHSGTVAKMIEYEKLSSAVALDLPLASNNASADNDKSPGAIKALPFEKAWSLYIANKDMYDSLQYVAGPSEKATIAASVILISGCQDNQLSRDGEKNGMFTGALKTVWASGTYARNYSHFRDDIVKLLSPTQTPNYYVVGATNLAYEAQRPFQI